MRLAVITNAYPPNARGGAGVIASELVELWRAAGHEVRVWQTSASWLQGNMVTRLIGHLWHDLKPVVSIAEIVPWKPDIVITHNLTGVGWATGAACQRAGLPWIHVLHDVQLFAPSGQIRHNHVTLWQRFWSVWRRRVFGTPTLVISPTNWLLDAHQQRHFTFPAMSVIQNPAPNLARKVASLKQSTWMYVGRLSEEKGADFIWQLANACPEESFVCIGDGPWRAALEPLPNMQCLGALPREEVQRYLAGAQGLLMPSRLQENQPTIIIEALAVGLPVIASPLGGIPETLGKGGKIVPLQTKLWVLAMQEVAEKKDLLSEAARKQANVFSRSVIQARWQEVFRTIGDNQEKF